MQTITFSKDDFLKVCPEWHFNNLFNSNEKRKVVYGKYTGKMVTEAELIHLWLSYKFDVDSSFDKQKQLLTITGEEKQIYKAFLEIGKHLGMMEAGY